MSSKKSFFSIPPAAAGSQASQGGTPRRNASAANLRRGSGGTGKPGWQGVYEAEGDPTSRRTSASDDSGELGAKTPPLTPPLLKLTRVKVEGEFPTALNIRWHVPFATVNFALEMIQRMQCVALHRPQILR